MWPSIKNWVVRLVADWGAGRVISIIGAALTLLWGGILQSVWAPVVAVLVFVLLLFAFDLAETSDVVHRFVSWLRGLLGIETTVVSEPPTASPTAASNSSDYLCRLWLYEQRLSRFNEHIDMARVAIVPLESLFNRAMQEELTQAEKNSIDTAQEKLCTSLLLADNTYEKCCHNFKNISLTNPCSRSQFPLANLDEWPEELQHEYRLFHDRLNSLRLLEEDMRNAFKRAINSMQGEISRAAHEAIERENPQ